MARRAELAAVVRTVPRERSTNFSVDVRARERHDGGSLCVPAPRRGRTSCRRTSRSHAARLTFRVDTLLLESNSMTSTAFERLMERFGGQGRSKGRDSKPGREVLVRNIDRAPVWSGWWW